jgi:rubrerythrin
MASEENITGAKLIAELNDLLQLDFDAIGAYTVAIESVESVTYRETLEGFRRDHERHVRELTKLIEAEGGTPVEASHVPTGAFKLAVQSLGAAGSDRSLILAFKANEGQAVEKYARHAERPHSDKVAAVLRRAARDEEKHYEWAESRLKRLGAGPNTAVGKAEAVMETVHGKMADAIEGVERKAMEGVEKLRGK